VHPYNQTTGAQWNSLFGNAAETVPVIADEWSEYANTKGECHDNAATFVPQFFSYLQQRQIGLGAWSLIPGVLVLNTTSFTPTQVTATYSCAIPSSQNKIITENAGDNGDIPVPEAQGAGQLLQNYFTQQYALTAAPPAAITQAAPTSNETTPAASSDFIDQLATTGSTGGVSFITVSATNGLQVSSSGAVSTTGTLAAGTYTASGTDTDTYGDTGTWSYTLVVTATTITQAAPTSGSTTTGTAFTSQLEVSGSVGTVTFTQSTGKTHLTISSSGAVSTTGTLAAGTDTAAGTDKDTYGDTGTWSYTLVVTAGDADAELRPDLAAAHQMPVPLAAARACI
jgi:hypothetical protein